MSFLADHFSDDEQVTLLEAARVALADADIFDQLAEDLDLADDELVQLREKLNGVMNKEPEAAEEDV